MSQLRATHLPTGFTKSLEHDETSEHLADWIRSDFERRKTARPVIVGAPIARPMTEAEWAEVERLRDIHFYRHQDELNGTEPIEIDEDDFDGEEEFEDDEEIA